MTKGENNEKDAILDYHNLSSSSTTTTNLNKSNKRPKIVTGVAIFPKIQRHF
jgi:hypothetical protein